MPWPGCRPAGAVSRTACDAAHIVVFGPECKDYVIAPHFQFGAAVLISMGILGHFALEPQDNTS
jgi:hypothetical protein